MGGILSRLLVGDAAAAAGGNTSEPSRVIAFHSSDSWKLYLNSSKQLNKLMVVNFTTTWCGPFNLMAPAFDQMVSKYTDVDFVKIDVDELGDVVKEFEVQAMPTFVLLKQGKVIDKVVGANKDELEKKITSNRVPPRFAA